MCCACEQPQACTVHSDPAAVWQKKGNPHACDLAAIRDMLTRVCCAQASIAEVANSRASWCFPHHTKPSGPGSDQVLDTTRPTLRDPSLRGLVSNGASAHSEGDRGCLTTKRNCSRFMTPAILLQRCINPAEDAAFYFSQVIILFPLPQVMHAQFSRASLGLQYGHRPMTRITSSPTRDRALDIFPYSSDLCPVWCQGSYTSLAR